MTPRQPSFFDDRPDPSAPGTKNPARPTDTQRNAAYRIRPRSGTARAKVLNYLATAVTISGATDEEMQGALGMNPNTQRPRRLELKEMGWIKDSGRRRRTTGGYWAIVWVVRLAAADER